MPFIIGGAIVGGSLLSGLFGASAADDAAKAQAQANAMAIAEQRRQYNQTRGDLGPYRDAGTGAINYYQDFLGANGPEAAARARERFQTSPGYEFELEQGLRGIEGRAAAGPTGFLSGGRIKAATEYATGLANREVGSYLDRFLGLTNLGENAAAQTGNFGAQSANNISNLYSDTGAAQAGGILGKANAYTGAIDNTLKLGAYGYGQGWFDGPSGGGSGGGRGY